VLALGISMSKTAQLSVGWARLVFEVLQREGLDANALFLQFDLKPEQLINPSAYFKQDNFTRLWHEACRLSENPAIGLTMGNQPTVNSFDAYSYSLMSRATVREALELTARYHEVIGSAAMLSNEFSSKGCRLIIESKGDELPVAYHGFEAALALQIFSLRLVTNQAIKPDYVTFKTPKPNNLAPYDALFQCPLKFNEPQYAMYINQRDLDIPMIFANESMALHHEKILQKTISELKTNTLVEHVQDLIYKTLPTGEPNIKAVASMFNMSQRTFQRRLKQHGHTFLELLDSTRKKLAAQYTANPEMSLQEISFLLGFTDNSNFYRAFKRWYGCAPGEYRQLNVLEKV
jgi:AraC-like DNA-binding protein